MRKNHRTILAAAQAAPGPHFTAALAVLAGGLFAAAARATIIAEHFYDFSTEAQLTDNFIRDNTHVTHSSGPGVGDTPGHLAIADDGATTRLRHTTSLGSLEPGLVFTGTIMFFGNVGSGNQTLVVAQTLHLDGDRQTQFELRRPDGSNPVLFFDGSQSAALDLSDTLWREFEVVFDFGENEEWTITGNLYDRGGDGTAPRSLLGTLTVNDAAYGTSANDVYSEFQLNRRDGGGWGQINIPRADNYGITVSQDQNQIPEPGSAALLGLFGLLMFHRRRRMRGRRRSR